MTQRVLDACPDAQWRVMVALVRFGELRCPSELLPLKWADVDWERSRVRITSPKTEHIEGKGERIIPLWAELRKYLLEAFEQAEPGTQHVVTRYRDATCNLRTHFCRIIGRAGLQVWPKPWHNMRSTRQTELSQSLPLYQVCAWTGNTQAVAQEHYLQMTDGDLERAVAWSQNAVQNPV